MPRTSTIRYYASRNAYYTKFGGRQHLLARGPKDEPHGPVYQQAVQTFARVVRAAEIEKTDDDSTLSAVIACFCKRLESEGRTATLRLSRTVLDPASHTLGSIRVRDLKPFAVREWVDGQTQWNSTTKHIAISQLSSALFWAIEQGLISKNPLASMKGKPEKLTRGKEAIIPEPLQSLLIAEARPPFALFLRLMQGTGARPGEIANADGKHYRADWGAIVFSWHPPAGEYRWKCGKKTKRDRIVYLTPDLQKLVEEQIKRHGSVAAASMPIACTPRRKRWQRRNLWWNLDHILKKPAIRTWCADNNFDPANVILYGFRHSYITKMLLAGCPIKLLADLCGTSVGMIEKNYSHAHDDPLAMRKLFLQFAISSHT